jgi:hypothetical protein
MNYDYVIGTKKINYQKTVFLILIYIYFYYFY